MSRENNVGKGIQLPPVKDEICFQIYQITYPKHMTLADYENLETKSNFFICGKAIVYRKLTTEFGDDIFHMLDGNATITLDVMIKMNTYIVYSAKHYTFKKNSKVSRDRVTGKSTTTSFSEYSVAKIENHYLLSPSHRFDAKNHPRFRKTIADIIREREIKEFNEYAMPIIGTPEYKSYETRSSYIGLKSFDRYKELLSFWKYRYIHGSKISDLLEIGRLIEKDVFQYLKDYPLKFLSVTELIELFRSNPLNWNPNEKLDFIHLSLLIHLLNESLLDQRMYEPKKGLVPKLENKWKDLASFINGIDLKHAISNIPDFLHLTNIGVIVHEENVYLRHVWGTEKRICEALVALQQNLSTFKFELPPNYETSLSEKMTDTQRICVLYIVKNYLHALHIIHGAAGTGKTTCVVELVRLILSQEIGNVLLVAFMGKTKTNILEKVLDMIPESMVDEGRLQAFTVDMFTKRISNIVYDPTKETDLHPLIEFCQNLQVVVIDEIETLDIFRFKALLDILSNPMYCPNMVKIIVVGDIDQILSISPGNLMHDLLIAMESLDPNNIVKLLTHHRFDTTSSICTNLALAYERSKDVKKKFKFDEKTIKRQYGTIEPPLQSTGGLDLSLCRLIDNIYQKYPAKDVQFYSYQNATCNIISDLIGKYFAKKYFSPSTEEEYPLPKFKHQNFFEPGRKIMMCKNYEPSDKKLHLMKSDLFEHMPSREYSNLEQLYNKNERLFSNSVEGTFTSDRCTNGQIDVVKSVAFAFEKKGEAVVGFYIIYTLLSNNQDIVVGPGAVSPNEITDGVCITIDKMIGCETNIGVWILPQRDWHMDYSRGIVALSRAKKTLYIIVESNQNGYNSVDMIQKIISNDRKERKSTLSKKIIDIFRRKRNIDDANIVDLVSVKKQK